MTPLSASDSQLSTSSSKSQRALVADDIGGGLSKAGADFLRRGGNDIVEAVPDGFSTPQANHDLGALLRGEGRGEGGVALQIGPLDQTKDLRIDRSRIIVFFDRAAREHGGDAEGNAHLGLQRISIRAPGIAAGIARRGFGDEYRNGLDLLRCFRVRDAARNAACAAVCAKLQAGAGLL